jgi:hypothetical protein
MGGNCRVLAIGVLVVWLGRVWATQATNDCPGCWSSNVACDWGVIAGGRCRDRSGFWNAPITCPAGCYCPGGLNVCYGYVRILVFIAEALALAPVSMGQSLLHSLALIFLPPSRFLVAFVCARAQTCPGGTSAPEGASNCTVRCFA